MMRALHCPVGRRLEGMKLSDAGEGEEVPVGYKVLVNCEPAVPACCSEPAPGLIQKAPSQMPRTSLVQKFA